MNTRSSLFSSGGRSVSSQGAIYTPLRPESRRNELSGFQREYVLEAFEVFDGNKDGSLDAHELRVAMRACGFEPTKAEIVEAMRLSGHDNASLISLAEYEKIMTAKILARDPEDEIKRMFDLIDTRKVGSIGIDELRVLANEVGSDVPEEELIMMIDEFDWDDDGRLNYEEFRQVMVKFQA